MTGRPLNLVPDFADPFAPPATVQAVRCLHCDRAYESRQMRWDVHRGLWACHFADCDGAGFGVDIHPADSPLFGGTAPENVQGTHAQSFVCSLPTKGGSR